MSEIITVIGDDITVSVLVWRRYRRPMPGMAEAILAANPGLAGLGVHIPVGTRVVIPAASAAVTPVSAITLYD